MEMEVDNLKMDMSGVELSVANAHRQIQRVEDEVVATLNKKVSDMYQDFFTSGGAMESRFDGTLEEHHDRLNAVELAKERTDKKCESVREVLTSWMVTFEALETSVGSVTDSGPDVRGQPGVVGVSFGSYDGDVEWYPGVPGDGPGPGHHHQASSGACRGVRAGSWSPSGSRDQHRGQDDRWLHRLCVLTISP
jgi:hypothetical protein